MSKRSTRIAKRAEFENSLKEVEEKLRSRRGNKSAAITPESTGRSKRPDGENEDAETNKPGKENSELAKRLSAGEKVKG
jgi:hypothetical protein